MKRKAFQAEFLRRLITALVLALCLVPIHSNPVAALSVYDFFAIDYEVTFSKTDILGSEIFNATVQGTATCNSELPAFLSPSRATITSRIVAVHQVSGARVTLNSGYTVNINPFPKQLNETVTDTKVVSLTFPAGSQSGTYTIDGELIVANAVIGGQTVDVSPYLPSSLTVGSVTYSSGSSSGVGGGGILPPTTTTTPSLPPGTKDVSGLVSAAGRFTGTLHAESPDNKSKLTIDEGTKGLTREGNPLTRIAITEMGEPPAPPENSSTVGLTYDLGPDGASFDPPIALTLTYEENQIPPGVAEEKLSIATWDESASEWVMLTGSTVDPETNTITAPVSHFTAFSILAHTRPATFTLSSLSITPGQIGIGEEITISALVTNSGDLADNYEMILKIDNEVIASRNVSLTGSGFETVIFTTSQDTAGTYSIDINGLSGTFTVTTPTPSPAPAPVATPATFNTKALTISPDSVDIGEEVTITVLIANTGDLAGNYEVVLKIDDVVVSTREVTVEGDDSQQVTFTASQETAGTHTVNVNELSGTFAVTETSPGLLINLWLIGGIFASFIIIV
ncbi:CARDB domain-containing protein, partial [Chloroflexota bacterium]